MTQASKCNETRISTSARKKQWTPRPALEESVQETYMFFKPERLTMCPTEYRFLAVHEVRTHLKVKIYLTLDVNERVANGLCLGNVRTEREKLIHDFQF